MCHRTGGQRAAITCECKSRPRPVKMGLCGECIVLEGIGDFAHPWIEMSFSILSIVQEYSKKCDMIYLDYMIYLFSFTSTWLLHTCFFPHMNSKGKDMPKTAWYAISSNITLWPLKIKNVLCLVGEALLP